MTTVTPTLSPTTPKRSLRRGSGGRLRDAQLPRPHVLRACRTKPYTGKAKTVTRRGNGMVEICFRDDITALNGQKHAVLPGKGVINSRISELLYNSLRTHEIDHHMVARIDRRTLLCHGVDMYPIEVVVRFRAAGSLAKRLGMREGTVCAPPVLEFYYKHDELGDPMLNLDHIHLLNLADAEEVAALYTMGLLTATHLRGVFKLAGLELVDVKLEYGRTSDGTLVLADEISPDTCRLQDMSSGEVLDKDLFRHDVGDVMWGYQKVYRRLRQATDLSEPYM